MDFDFKQLSQKLTNNSKESLLESGIIAREFSYPEINSAHLLYAIFLRQGSVGSNILKDMRVKKNIFDKTLSKHSPQIQLPQQSIHPFSENLKKIIIQAFSVARDFGYPYVGTEHLIYVIISSDDPIVKEILSSSNSKNTPAQIQNTIHSILESDTLANLSKMLNIPEIATIRNRAHQSESATPFIDKFCININQEKSTQEETVIGRDAEIERMIRTLGRKNKNNPLLIGDPGVGKTALVTGLAQRINTGDVPFSLYKKRIMNLDVAQLISGTSFRGEFENRLKEIIRETIADKNIILFIDEIHTIIGAGNISGSLDLANIIKPALARGDFQLIGATTQSEYKKHIEKDPALERRFQSIQVHEPTKENAIRIILGIREYYEKFHNVSLSDSAVRQAVELSTRYIQGRFLPDKAIDIIDEASSLARSRHKAHDFIHEIKNLEQKKLSLLQEKEKSVAENNFEKATDLRNAEKKIEEEIELLHKKQSDIEAKNKTIITDQDIAEVVAKISGIPQEKISQEIFSANKPEHLQNIQKVLTDKLIGQEEIIEKITMSLVRSQAGISDPERPIGSFLFLGPSGVGKTFAAKILAEEFFGSGENKISPLIRIDMSELAERHSLSSLIGSPAGYIGYGEGGKLTEKVRRHPYSVILFDEIEKAHPDIFNILLQILEEGMLTDAEGLRVSFKNTIIIMTSNIGTQEFTAASKLGFSISQDRDSSQEAEKDFSIIQEKALQELKKRMRLEIMNRIDHILVFKSLGSKEIQKIAAIEIKKLKTRIKKQNIEMRYKKSLPQFIAKNSFSVEQGARLIRKNIQEQIENPIAKMIVEGKIKNNQLSINIQEDKINISS